MALGDTLAKAHLALGNAVYVDWDWSGAEKEYERALELDPNSAEAHCSYAGFLDSMGRFDEGLKEKEIQLQLDPDLDCPEISPLVPLESQIDRDRRFMATHPVTFAKYWNLGLMLWKTGRLKEADEVWQDWMISPAIQTLPIRWRHEDGYPGDARMGKSGRR